MVDACLTPGPWMASVFGLLRRKLDHIDRFARCEPFVDELCRRGHHAIPHAGQMIIFCNNELVRVILQKTTLVFHPLGTRAFRTPPHAVTPAPGSQCLPVRGAPPSPHHHCYPCESVRRSANRAPLDP
jgi:hypothetical protein